MKTISYDILRAKIKDDRSHIWIFGTASDSLFSRIIRFFTRAKISHVGFLVYFYERLWVIEMMEGAGCRILPASNRLNKEAFVQIGRIKTNKFQIDFVTEILEDVNFVKYDLAGALLSPLFDTKTGQSFCSEWVAKKAQIQFTTLQRGIFPTDVMEKCKHPPYQLIF